jgi:hypothetical protein
MKPAFNRSGGIWRQAEMRTLDLADQYGAVQVRVEPVYSENPPRLSDGTPIPYEIRRTVYGPTGNVLDHIALPNL